MKSRRSPAAALYPLLGLLLVAVCALLLSPAPPLPDPTSTPTPTPTPTPLPTPTPPPDPSGEPADTGWLLLQPGVELRHVQVEVDRQGTSGGEGIGYDAERLTIVRLDPGAVRFRVHYDPGDPLPVSGWAGQLDALLIVNGGYFTPEHETTGLLVSDGLAWGSVYGDYAGLFAVTAAGDTSVRWLRDRPYDPAEPLAQAVMSFPVLVKPGGVMGFPADAGDERAARRTVVGQDPAGRILLVVAPRGLLSLHRTARFLAESDLDLDVALNLDGGFSTGLWLNVGGARVEIDSHVPVPSVIAVENR